MIATLVLNRSLNSAEIDSIVGCCQRTKRLKAHGWERGRYVVRVDVSKSEATLLTFALSMTLCGSWRWPGK